MPILLDLIFYVIAGAGVGIAVGLTGVGGGSLMTPILILFGIPPKVAIGTDLLYAAFTKTGAMVSHHRQQNIVWPVVFWICLGSIPASLATTLLLKSWMEARFDYGAVLTCILGLMLIATAVVVLIRSWQQSRQQRKIDQAKLTEGFSATLDLRPARKLTTLGVGVALGVLVTLTSVGAGAIGAALLITLFPLLPASRIVGTDIAHAVPLTLVAGLGHLYNQHVDFVLLAGLLLGSLPAVHIASAYSKRVPSNILRNVLAIILLLIGARLIFTVCF